MPLFDRYTALTLAAAAIACASGCTLISSVEPITEQSLLRAAQPSADAVTLDIFWVRLPEGNEADLATIWSQVSEDRLPVALREQLASNGLRAGIVGAATPNELLRLIDPEGAGETSTDGATVLRDTGVRRRTKQMRPGRRIELTASEILDEAPLLISHGGRVTGQTYRRLQGVYTLEVDGASDGGVQLRLTPEVQHGEPRLRFASDEMGAMARGSLKRSAEVFSDLEIEAGLASGEMLLVTNLPSSGSRLGGLFHEDAGQRKAILVRLAQAPTTLAFLADN